jgi:hypothetical protein
MSLESTVEVRMPPLISGYYVDVIIVGIIVLIYLVVWLRTGQKELADASDRQLVYASIKDAVSIGITSSSILLPTAIAISIYLLKGELRLESPERDLIAAHFSVAIISYIICLLLGTYNLFRLPTCVHQRINLAYEKWTAIFGFCQAFSFLLAVWRTLCGFWVLV